MTTGRRLNVGCGIYALAGWINLDQTASAATSLVADGTALPFQDASLEEVYAGHFLEHLPRFATGVFLAECVRCLVPGGRLGLVIPDTREIMTRYVARKTTWVEYPVGQWHDMADLDEIAACFLYSIVQDSPHQWSYDLETLVRTVEAAGFRQTGEINRWLDPRIPMGAWYQTGADFVKQETA